MKTPEAIWLAFGLIASGLGLVRLLNELKRALKATRMKPGFILEDRAENGESMCGMFGAWLNH